MLTEDQKIEVRSFLGYPVGGNPPITPAGAGKLLGGLNGHRFFQASGDLEFRMNNLQPLEEAKLFGQSTGVVRVLSNLGIEDPVGAGLDLSITLSIQGVDIDIVNMTTDSGDTVLSIGTILSNAINASAFLAAESFQSLAPTNILGAPFLGLQIMCPKDFAIVVTGDLPVVLSVTPGSGIFKSPKVTFEEEGVVRGYIPILTLLEDKTGSVSDNLDTAKADVWTARVTEPQDRVALFDEWRGKLSKFLNVPLFEDTPHQARYMRGRRGGGRGLMTV